MKARLLTTIAIITILSCIAGAQTRQLELSGHYSALSEPYVHAHGIGIQASFDFNRRLGLDSNITFYPADNHPFLLPAGSMVEALGGIRFAVIRSERVGMFARLRPGILRLSNLRSEVPEIPPPEPGLPVIPAHTTTYGAQTNFVLDFGGTVEFYPTRRTFIRADFGDNYVHYGALQKAELVPGDPPTLYEVDFPAHAEHQYKMTFGAGWRFGTARSDAIGNRVIDSERRWTAGVQYSTMYIDGWRSGAGAQVTRRIGRLAEWKTIGNVFPGNVGPDSVLWYGQRIVQFQTGPGVQFLSGKVVSMKAHARPGFLHFSDYILLAPLDGEHMGPQNEFDLNYGIGAEFNFWRRVPLSIEVSDNLIKHADIKGTYMRTVPFWDHAPQVSIGKGFRF